MRAIGYRVAGDSGVLEQLEVAEPEAGPHDLLVEVRAVSVNPVDAKLRAAANPRDGHARILGFDAAGVVRSIGREVTLFKVGDEVFHAGSIARQGTNAELHLVDERIAGAKPRTLSFLEAAALPLTTITAWELLFDRLRVARGDEASGSLFIINGAGGVGSILIQLASRLTGLTVIATASRPETREWVTAMGAHHVIDHHQPLQEELAALGIRQVEYIAGLTDTGRHLPVLAKIIAPQGHLALIDDPATFDIVPFRSKAVTVAWEGMFVRSLFGTPDMIAQHRLLNEVAALVDAGSLRTTLRRDMGPLTVENLACAHDLVASGTSFGKVALTGMNVS